MKRIPLIQFVEDRGQLDSALLLGCTQGAISKALRVGRDITVTEHADGSFTAEELKPFPNQAARPASARSAAQPQASPADSSFEHCAA